MKKRFFNSFSVIMTIIMSILVMSMQTFAYESGSVGIDDQAGLYSTYEIEKLEARQQEVSDYTGWNIAVVTTDIGLGEGGSNAIAFAEDYYDKTFGASSTGLLYLIDIDYRHICIAGNADYYYFNDYRVNKMIDECNDRYMDYDDVGNLNAFYDNIEKYYDAGYFTEKHFSFPVALIVGLIAAGIGIAIVFSRYKFHHKPSANTYLNKGTVNFYRRNDRFVREFTTRTKIESSSGGSSGSSGSSGGGSHGGGGRGGRR